MVLLINGMTMALSDLRQTLKMAKKEGYEIYWEKNGDVKSKTLYEDGKPVK